MLPHGGFVQDNVFPYGMELENYPLVLSNTNEFAVIRYKAC